MVGTTKRRTGKRVFCRNDEHGTMDFYLDLGSERFFLFRTRYYSQTIFHEYDGGKSFETILSYTPKKRRSGLSAKRLEMRKIKLKERIVRAVKYVERERDLFFVGTDNQAVA